MNNARYTNWWSFRKSIGWWVSNAGGCKIWSWKQRISQRRPVETGQRSSDDEVSKPILHDRKREFFWRKLKMSESLTSSLESVYIVFVERLLICLVIVAMVEGCNRSSLLVSDLYRPMKNLVNSSLEGWTRPWLMKSRWNCHGRLRSHWLSWFARPGRSSRRWTTFCGVVCRSPRTDEIRFSEVLVKTNMGRTKF